LNEFDDTDTATGNQRLLELRPALVMGGYELVRRLGRGGMGEVWVAKRLGRGRIQKNVAIKVVADHLVGSAKHIRLLQVEADLSAVLTHANIVQVFDAGTFEGRGYLVMEWVDGSNLIAVREALGKLDDLGLRDRLAAYVVGQLLHALAYAHALTSEDGRPLGIVHRDISPHNVLVSNHGDVKLADFGVAHVLYEESSGIHVKGKVRYMAPEHLAGHTRSPVVDLYGAGAILHELLEGEKFRGDVTDERVLLAQILSGKNPPLRRRIDPALDAVRLALLHPDPTRRIQRAKDALAMLARWPGYREMKLELGRVCSMVTGITAPRTGYGGASARSPMASASNGTSDLVPVASTGLPFANVPSIAATPGWNPEFQHVPWAPESDPSYSENFALRGAGMQPETTDEERIQRTPTTLSMSVRDSGRADPTHAWPHGTTRRNSSEREETHRWSETRGRSPGTSRSRNVLGWIAGFAMLSITGFFGGAWWLYSSSAQERSDDPGPGEGDRAEALGQPNERAVPKDLAGSERTPAEGKGGDAAIDGTETLRKQSEETIENVTASAMAPPDDGAVAPSGEGATVPATAGHSRDSEPPARVDASASMPSSARSRAASGSTLDRSRVRPTEPDDTPSTTMAVTVAVHVRLSGYGAVHLQLGPHRLAATPYYDGRLPVGRYTLRWSTSPSGPWTRGPGVTLEDGKEYVLRVDAQGLRWETR